MTSLHTVNEMVNRLAQIGPLSVEAFADLLGASLPVGDDNDYWTFHPFALASGPFGRGELRLSKAGNAALLILEPADPPGLNEDELDTTGWGEAVNLAPNPHIPPEGTDTYEYDVNGVKTSVQWTHQSRRLRNLVLEWSPPPNPAVEVPPG